MQELSGNLISQADRSANPRISQECSRLAIKSTNEYSKGMVALKTYRNGVNFIKNQSNTMNQVNISKNESVSS